MRRAFVGALALAVSMHVVVGLAQTKPAKPTPPPTSDGPLTFFKNYFVTGDYAVAGVGLRGTGVNGFATGVIKFQDSTGGRVIPLNADIMAAFLFWETVETPNSGGGGGAKFRGQDLTDYAYTVNPAGTAPCWSSGGATGASNGAHKMFLRRADVARFLPVGLNGKTTVNKKDLDEWNAANPTAVPLMLDVSLPDAGSGNSVPSSAGASLVVVYRLPYQQTADAAQPIAATPYKSVVIYNGGFTLDHDTPALTQKLKGFYQAAGTTARLTHIVADGQSNFGERLLFDNALVENNPFSGADGPAGDPAWDDRTFNVTFSSPPQTDTNGQFASTTVDSQGLSSYDCLSWGAVVFSTEVKDTDADGMLDIWEESRSTPLVDPAGQPLPNLYGMGARKDVKDVFFQIGYMSTAGYTTDAQTVPAHSHMPSKSVLDAVGDAYKNAPVSIQAHFDVGSAYQTNPADSYIIPAELARSGEPIDETIGCSSDVTGKTTCAGQFPAYPGTVGWKTGYRFLRDEPTPVIDEPGRLRFDANRLPMFHYVLWAHNLGLPRCFGQTATDGTDLCVEGNAGFHVPTKTSGIADPPGGDILITLGRWDDFKGTEYVQTSSLFHEAGHNTGLRHYGVPTYNTNGTLAFQPNCRPNYQSVMNYLFQVQGLMCLAGSTSPQCAGKDPGTPVIDYSRQTLPALDEREAGVGGSGLNEASGLGTTLYAARWYAPKLSSYVDNDTLGIATTPPTRYCDGTPIPSPAPSVDIVRIDGTTLGPALDWDADGIPNETILTGQDLSFGGTTALLAAGTTVGINGKPIGDDWSNVDLRHVASRRNVGGLSLGVGSTDLTDSDPGKGDTGKGDTGKGDTGKGDTGKGDTGKGDTGKGDTGKGDTGSFAAPFGDLEFDTAAALGNAPTLLTFKNAQKSVTLNWFRPNAGTPISYEVYRMIGTLSPATFAARMLMTTITGMNGQRPATTFVDTTVKNNTTYTYFVVAVHPAVALSPVRSGPSNFVTVVR